MSRTQVNARQVWQCAYNCSLKKQNQEFNIKVAHRTSHVGKLWVWSRDSDSINKVQEWLRMVPIVNRAPLDMHPHICVPLTQKMMHSYKCMHTHTHMCVRTHTLTLWKRGKGKECGQSLLFNIGLTDKEAMRRIQQLACGCTAKDWQRSDPAWMHCWPHHHWDAFLLPTLIFRRRKDKITLFVNFSKMAWVFISPWPALLLLPFPFPVVLCLSN